MMEKNNNLFPITTTSTKFQHTIKNKLSIESLSDELLYSVVLFAGEKTYSSVGCVSHRFNHIFKKYKLPKSSAICLAPIYDIDLILQTSYTDEYFEDKIHLNYWEIANSLAIAVAKFNRDDIIDLSLKLDDPYLCDEIGSLCTKLRKDNKWTKVWDVEDPNMGPNLKFELLNY